MRGDIALSPEQGQAFRDALQAMASFRRVFGRSLDPALVAELHVVQALDLCLCRGSNTPGFDALDRSGKRYQIKLRAAQNVDLQNFDFDYLVLVNLDDDFGLAGMWRVSAGEARALFTWREKFRKYQATQSQLKAVAERMC